MRTVVRFGEGLCTPCSMYCILCVGEGIIIWVPNTDSKVHDRLWVAVAALILGALCDEGQGPCVDLLRVVGVLPVGLSLVTFPG